MEQNLLYGAGVIRAAHRLLCSYNQKIIIKTLSLPANLEVIVLNPQTRQSRVRIAKAAVKRTTSEISTDYCGILISKDARSSLSRPQ